MSTIPGLSSVDDILDSDLVMITHANGQSYKMAGIEINKRNQAVIASNTTLTGAPLKTGNVVRAYFTADLVAANSSTALSLSYNSVSYPVKVPKDGALVNYTPFEVEENTYKYLQAYTTLELLYDGTNLIVLNNPVVISGSGFNIHADGSGKVNEVAANNMQTVTSAAVSAALSYTTTEHFTGLYWYNGKKIYSKAIYSATGYANDETLIDNANIEEFVKIDHISSDRSGIKYQSPYNDGGGNYSYLLMIGSVIKTRKGGIFLNTNFPATTILLYTKTTD